MERIAEAIAITLIKNKIFEEKSKAFYQYGLQLGLELGLNILISIVIAVVLKMEVETIVFLTLFQLFRSYAGGFHLNSYLACTFFSSLTLISVLYLAKIMNCDYWVMGIITYVSNILIVICGPVGDINTPLSMSKKKECKRKLLLTCLFVLLLFMLLLIRPYVIPSKIIMLTSVLMLIVLLLGKIKLFLSDRK
ncbi:MAG: hypothetical protein E7296_12735 [Lachnospiraceae bacterium]|jgi:accessory gene regulator protein AgrB|nr:hypothetical protein [Lachnospiraceae bacterium]